MSHKSPSVTNLRKVLVSAFFMLATASILIGLTTMDTYAGEPPKEPMPVVTEEPTLEVILPDPTAVTTEAVTLPDPTVEATVTNQPGTEVFVNPDPTPNPKAVIGSKANSYIYTGSPQFDIETGSNKYFKVEIALTKDFFTSSTNRYKSGDKQNYYTTTWKECTSGGNLTSLSSTSNNDCKTTYSLPSATWKNLRGSVVFYRVLTNNSQSDTGAQISEVKDDTYINRTGESWYGLPLNNKASVFDLVKKEFALVVNNGQLQMGLVESDYGPRNAGSGTRFHPGLDISVPKLTPIYAIADGKVKALPNYNNYGRLDIVHLEDSNNEYRSGYLHLESAVVAMNQDVKAGQLIAFSGNTRTRGLHLHFEAGFTSTDKYHNPLNYISNSNNHTVDNLTVVEVEPGKWEGTFLADGETNYRAIDITESQTSNIVLIGFGITTFNDKDLNYVKVSADNSVDDYWHFLLNYNDVFSDPQTGVVTMGDENGKKFRIVPMNYDIYEKTNLTDLFYVMAATTQTGDVAKDYFFLPWKVENLGEDAGFHIIEVEVAEVGSEKTPARKTVSIGPELIPSYSPFQLDAYVLHLWATNHDVPGANGELAIEVKGLEAGLPNWLQVDISPQFLSIGAGETEEVIVTLTSTDDHVISADFLRENNIRIIATHGRIDVLQDNYVICPANGLEKANVTGSQTASVSSDFCPGGDAQALIQTPTDGSNVPVNETVEVKVFAPGAAGDAIASLMVKNLSGGYDPSAGSYQADYRIEDTFVFENWEPAQSDVEYALIAQVTGFVDSEVVNVTAIDNAVYFIQPTDCQQFFADEGYKIIVAAPPDTTSVELDIQGSDSNVYFLDLAMTKANNNTWEYKTSELSSDQTYYELTATAFFEDGGNDIARVKAYPKPEDPKVVLPNRVKAHTATTIMVWAPKAANVSLDVAYDPFAITHVDGEPEWYFTWEPWDAVEHIITATVQYFDFDPKFPQASTTVEDNPDWFEVLITQPGPGSVVTANESHEITVEAQEEIERFRIWIQNEEGEGYWISKSRGSRTSFQSYTFHWKPQPGIYTIKAYAEGQNDRFGTSEVRTVEAAAMRRTDINEDVFQLDIEDLEATYISPLKSFDTQISTDEYVCGVVGFYARHGNILESNTSRDIIDVFAYPDVMDGNPSKKSWHVVADFRVNPSGWPQQWDAWDVSLWCMSTRIASYGGPHAGKPIFIERVDQGLGNWHEIMTSYTTSDYTCGAVGFLSGSGEITKGKKDYALIIMDVFENNGKWGVWGDFRTEKKNLIHWRTELLCIDNDWVAKEDSEIGKSFVYKRFKNLGSDRVDHSTEFLVDEWACGIVGFVGDGGDIDEKGSGRLFEMRMVENQGGTWSIRSDFRSHNSHESWDVNVLCTTKEGVTITNVEPYLFTGKDSNGDRYGPGMKIDFTDSHDPQANYYRIQYSTNGGKPWTNIWANPRKLSDGSWINHHGWNSDCGWDPSDGGAFDLYGRCLQPNTIFFYRVGLLENIDDEDPINGHWSDPVSATSYDWPAYFELNKYRYSGADPNYQYFHVSLINVHGNDFRVNWSLPPKDPSVWDTGGGCVDGLYEKNTSTGYCIVKLRHPNQTNVSSVDAVAADPGPITGITITVEGEDYYPKAKVIHKYSDIIYVVYDDGEDDDDRDDIDRLKSTFGDVPSDHWANTYVEYLAELEITSGCSTDGESNFCPDDSLLRSQQAVFTVRSRHPEEPGYVPPTPEEVIFMDEEAQPLASVASTSPDVASRPATLWHDKYFDELYKEGVISGCSVDPVKVCPNEVTTRAQMTVFVVRMLHGEEFTPPEPEQQTYHDAPLFNMDGSRIWSVKWIKQATQDGLVQVCGTDMDEMLFRPEEAVTRAEVACMMYFALQTID